MSDYEYTYGNMDDLLYDNYDLNYGLYPWEENQMQWERDWGDAWPTMLEEEMYDDYI